MFENGVSVFDEETKQKVKEKFKARFREIFRDTLENAEYEIKKENNEKPERYLCFTCKKNLLNGKVPSMAVANGLSLIKVDENLNLTQLENNLIAKKILFQKVFKLPKSRMAALKDQIVNIPIGDEDVLNTVQTLPRTPSEAGLIEVKLKRKLGYKNYHQYEYINPDKVFHALKYLKDIGNPHYQFYEEKEEFEKRCFNNDPYGFETMFGEVDDATDPMSNNVRFVHDDDVDTMMDLQDFKVLREVSEEEKVDKENDPTRKFQIDYDKSVCLTQQFPEAFFQETEKK